MSHGDYPERSLSSIFLRAARDFLLLLVAAELLFRILFPLPEVSNFNRITYSPRILSPVTRSGRFLMNTSIRSISEPDAVESVHGLNLYGFRGPTWRVSGSASQERVAFVGSSMVEGFFAADPETIPAAFERSARNAGVPVEAMNLGVGGTAIPRQLELIRDAVSIFRPDGVILVVEASNLPFLAPPRQSSAAPLTPVFSRWWMPRIVEVYRRLRAGRRVATRWRQGPADLFAPVPDPSNPWSRDAARLEAVVEPGIADAMRRGRFNPFFANALKNMKRSLRAPANVRRLLALVKRYADQSLVPISVVYLPFAPQVSDYYLPFYRRFSEKVSGSIRSASYQTHAASLGRRCAELGIPFLDLTPALRQQEDRGIRMYWDHDAHLRGRGYVFVGETVHAWWHALRESQAANR
jgi:hypothetical protein